MEAFSRNSPPENIVMNEEDALIIYILWFFEKCSCVYHAPSPPPPPPSSLSFSRTSQSGQLKVLFLHFTIGLKNFIMHGDMQYHTTTTGI